MTYNLKIYIAFATGYRNTSSRLKGIENAKNNSTGTFNDWKERNYKTKPAEDNGKATLQLRSDIYEKKIFLLVNDLKIHIIPRK